ncbi:MAG: SPFH/Band 7/PHB domain protein [Rhodoluna sp.]|jgi:regulator of protease activity HflC (stomatin/prohibitin superfamily)|nr:SPFH/Band 7/PHB domain protein [Rhodoluna sp.]
MQEFLDVFAALVLPVILITIFVVILARSIRIIPQASAGIVERLGRYHRTLDAGLALVVPFIDRLRPLIDLREKVVSFPPQPVITSDNLVVEIDTVIYFQVTNPKSAVYEIENYITGIEQITITTLRNVVGGIDLEQTLTSRDSINSALRGVLDEATGKWGVRVNRVELKSIEPPQTVKTAMELQMKAERERRAVILTAEGEKQSQILTAEGARQAAILNAEGAAKAIVIKAEAEAEAVQRVFDAVRTANLDEKMLAYQYLEQLPVIANGTASKIWLLPAELTGAIEKIASAFRPGK